MVRLAMPILANGNFQITSQVFQKTHVDLKMQIQVLDIYDFDD
jgi:hypothetical protein